MNDEQCCWVCNGLSLTEVKASGVRKELDSSDFEITDKAYGITAAIYCCQACGFLQCSDLDDVLKFYAEMDDSGYEETRDQRALQAKRIIVHLAEHKASGRLLDVGAGSGILVEQALAAGYMAVGVEPSKALCEKATELNLPVTNTVLPDHNVGKDYDLVTLIDIVEHVTDPLGLISDAVEVLADDGRMIVVTPDVKSVAARLMGWRWWHFRIAHVGYFSKSTMELLLDRAGLEVVSYSRPSWYFPADYLVERVLSYFPKWLRPPVPKFLGRFTVPLNLFDSISVVCRKKG